MRRRWIVGVVVAFVAGTGIGVAISYTNDGPVTRRDVDVSSACGYDVGSSTRFVASATVEDVGRVEVTATWELSGGAVTSVKRVEVEPGTPGLVRFAMPVTREQIARHRSAGGVCTVTAEVIGDA